MKSKFVVALAVALYWTNSAMAAAVQVPSECKNLALMQTQLLDTQFHNNEMGGGTYNPAKLTLSPAGKYQIGKVEYLGGDGEDTTGANAGKYPCDLHPNLCTNPADAGGAIDWARVTVKTTGAYAADVTQVVVSMGSRGGCRISSARYLSNK